jgi:hypothetical protein
MERSMLEEFPLSQEEERALYNVVSGIRRARALDQSIMLTITLEHGNIETTLFAERNEPSETESEVSINIKEKLRTILELQIETGKTLERTARLREENAQLRNGIIEKIVEDHPRKDFLKQKLGL